MSTEIDSSHCPGLITSSDAGVVPVSASDIITDPVERNEFASKVSDTVLLYNNCKRCGRRIKAPQEYGRVCAKKVKSEAVSEL